MTTFEIISLIVSAGLLIATAGATTFAWKMALEADHSKADAEKARDAAVQAQKETAAALSAANTIAKEALDAQRLALPPEWGSPEQAAGRNAYAMKNNSGRTIVVKELASVPGGNVYTFIPPDLPARVEHGDVVRFSATLGGATSSVGNSVWLRWCYEDETGPESLTVRRF